MHILYKCNGKQCPEIVCEGEGECHSWADDRKTYSPCKYTLNPEFAINGPIKGPIDLFKRFKIHFKPMLYLEEV